MRKCRNCPCRSCLNTCAPCENCIKPQKTCRKRKGFKQMSLFAKKKQRHHAPRESWDYYGITQERYIKLRFAVQSGIYDDIAHFAANKANKDIAEYILLSATKNKSYEGVEYVSSMGRIPCGRTDFYGYRRLFYHIFDEELRKKEKDGLWQRN